MAQPSPELGAASDTPMPPAHPSEDETPEHLDPGEAPRDGLALDKENIATSNTPASLQNAAFPAPGSSPKSSIALISTSGLGLNIPTPTSKTPTRSPISAAGLHVHTNLPSAASKDMTNPPSTTESDPIGQAASSALGSPGLGAMPDITPLPSPLTHQDSPGPWRRAASENPFATESSSSSKEEGLFIRGQQGSSPKKSKKGYGGLLSSGVEASSMHSRKQQGERSHSRNRSLSEFVPEALHNTRPRHVTYSAVAPPTIIGERSRDTNLHREHYLAAQRGLTQATPSNSTAALPTPPPSNRSVTESEAAEEAREVDTGATHITLRDDKTNKKLRYRPLRPLGQGTFSKVMLATSDSIPPDTEPVESSLDQNSLVAIKIVEHGPAGGADEARVESSLKREVDILRSISHPSLAHLKAFGCDDNQALLVLGYCPGGDLLDVGLKHQTTITPRVIQRIAAELVDAIRYLHKKLIVHRDIKLENVLLNIPCEKVPTWNNLAMYEYPLITLADFGLSRYIPEPPASPLLTTRCGSEDYTAPEILLAQPYDGRETDAWALGVLLYGLMEGRLPFDPMPGQRVRTRLVHRIARCDWGWSRFGDDDGEWDPMKGAGWEGARTLVGGLLKKRGRLTLDDAAALEWIKEGIQVQGGLKTRNMDVFDEVFPSSS
ncbi:kinase-like protein [Aulographum hederae CBS 113979]|uniref:Kinase-like protein n=1 Tax=Aulographum hederae CBS 113979 TaxID=1176131 RepID=A0A6G1GJJ1_9PEZI|nr:kinase-like protein [Aulographum hederae CBS 113979]